MTNLMEIIEQVMEPWTEGCGGSCCKMTLRNFKDAIRNVTTEDFSDKLLISTMDQMGFKYKFYWSEIEKMQSYWLIKMKDPNAII